MIDFAAANLANNLIETDDPDRGVAMLEELLTRPPANRYYIFYDQLAHGYFALGQYARAIDAANTSISLAREKQAPSTCSLRRSSAARKPTESWVKSRMLWPMPATRSHSSSRVGATRSAPTP